MINPYQFSYILHSGKVYSSDGDIHEVSCERLLQLYRLPRDVECIKLPQDLYIMSCLRTYESKGDTHIHTYWGLPSIDLFPDPTGKYSLEDALFQHALERL